MTDVLVRGSAGWHSIYAGAVPGSVNAAKADLSFRDIVGQNEPAAETKFIRNAANTDWLPLDIINPVGPILTYIGNVYMNALDSENITINVGPEFANRHVVFVIASRGNEGVNVQPSVVRKGTDSSSPIVPTRNNPPGELGLSPWAFSIGIWSDDYPLGTTYPLRVERGSNDVMKSRVIYVYAVDKKGYTYDPSISFFDFSVFGANIPSFKPYFETQGPWLLVSFFGMSVAPGTTDRPVITTTPITLNSGTTTQQPTYIEGGFASRAIDFIQTATPEVAFDANYDPLSGESYGRSYFALGFR